MVTENVEQLSLETTDSPIDIGAAEVDTSPQETVEAPQAEAEVSTEAAQAPAQGPVPSAQEQPQSQPAGVAPPTQPQYTPDQIARMQQEAAQYAQVQQRAALQNQADQYKRQLEEQGYMPEQAEQAANHYVQSQQQQQILMQQAEQYGQHLQGQQAAAEQFAAKYNLGISDLAALRTHNDPQSMENAAKKMAGDRERDAELARLKQAQVPAQSFDNSQGNPQVAADEGGWLDRYNGGDRSPSAQAAARKAAGLG